MIVGSVIKVSEGFLIMLALKEEYLVTAYINLCYTAKVCSHLFSCFLRRIGCRIGCQIGCRTTLDTLQSKADFCNSPEYTLCDPKCAENKHDKPLICLNASFFFLEHPQRNINHSNIMIDPLMNAIPVHAGHFSSRCIYQIW